MDENAARSSNAPTYVIQGRTVSIPVEVRDATSISAMFIVPAAGVRQLMAPSRLQVAEVLPGRALCVIAGITYRDNDLGRYNEVSVAFFVQPGNRRPLPLVGVLAGLRRGDLGAYIHRLPVTTSFSRDAGRDIWGFPKSVEDITFQDAGGQCACTLCMDGSHVLTLAVPRGGRHRMRDRAQDVYACRDGVLYKTPSVMGGDAVGFHIGSAVLTLGSHPVAEELRGLGLPRRALLSTWVEHMHARFAAPQRL